MLVFTIGVDKLYQEPIQFYFQKDIANQGSRRSRRKYRLNTLGTIIHETLNHMTLCRGFISESDIQNCFKQIDDEVETVQSSL
jgi:hypothetical protein